MLNLERIKHSWLCGSLFLMIAAAGIGCSKDEEAVIRDGTGNDTDTSSEDTGGDADTDADTDADGDADYDTENRPAVPICLLECESPLDCTEPGNDVLHGLDNYACASGVCMYAGCNSDAECDEYMPGMDYRCNASGGCQPACSAAADCVPDLTTPDADEDNFSCEGGICISLGCMTDDECQMSYGSKYACMDPMNTGVRSCQLGCADANEGADCVLDVGDPAMDSDNYECLYKKCYYTGCKSDEECGAGRRCVKLGV